MTNAEWVEFIEDGRYTKPLLWLSKGWAKALAEGWSRRITSSEDDRRRRSKDDIVKSDCIRELECGKSRHSSLVFPSLRLSVRALFSSWQRRVSGTCFFGITSPRVANDERRAYLPRDVCGNERTLLGSKAEEGDRR